MTTGRINQVRTIGGARARAGPCPPGCGPQRALVRPPGPASRRAPSRFVGGHAASARSRRLRTPGRVSPRLGGARLGPGRGPSCPCGVAPAGALSPAPGLRRPRARPGPGGFRRPGASPRASEECTSGRAGGRAAHAGWPPWALARQPPACAPLSLKLWRAPRYCQAVYCDSDEGVRPVGHSQRASPGMAAPAERHLQVTRRPPLASPPEPVSTRRLTGAMIRTPHGRPPARAWLRRRA